MSGVYDEAARELQNSRLYVDPEAEREFADAGIPFDAAAQDDARQTLDGASTDIYVAVLPASADTSGAAQSLGETVGRQGTYVVLLSPDGRVNAASTEFDGANSTAISASEDPADASGFIDSVVADFEELAAGGGSDDARSPADSSGGSGWLPLAILAAAGGGGFLLYRRNKRSRERTELEQVRTALDEDITTYGEQLSALDLNVKATSSVPIEARDEYSRALDLYERAKNHSDRAERADDLQPVTHDLEEGRWLLGCVDARLKGEPVPERRLPCFFDPGHGPSTEDIEWAPAGGTIRTVPACAADALRVKNGSDPNIRMVRTDHGEQRPYWDAGPAYGGWAGGYFGGFLPGMMMGTMLGSALYSPVGMDGGGFDGGGGDFGGGFEGGDFGGGFGDFGGGFGD